MVGNVIRLYGYIIVSIKSIKWRYKWDFLEKQSNQLSAITLVL